MAKLLKVYTPPRHDESGYSHVDKSSWRVINRDDAECYGILRSEGFSLWAEGDAPFEALFRCWGGAWVRVWVNHDSLVVSNCVAVYEILAGARAAEWFIENGFDTLPNDLLCFVESRLLPTKPGENEPLVKRKASTQVVYETTTGKEYRLETEAEPKWGPIEYGSGWDGSDGFYHFTNSETLYQRGNRFILLLDRAHFDLPGQETTCRFLSEQEAVDWMIRNSFDPPAAVAHLQSIRSIDDLTADELTTLQVQQAELRAKRLSEISSGKFLELESLFPCDPPELAATRDDTPAVAAGGGDWPNFDAPTSLARTDTSLLNEDAEAAEVKSLNSIATNYLEERADELRQNPHSLTDRKLAQAIGCSSSTASKLPVWKKFKERRGKRKPTTPRAPKAVSMTPKLEACLGQPDEGLQRLLAEHEDDYEPSPLEPELPHRRRPKGIRRP